MSEPRLADAAERPCQVRLSHNPTPVRTQSHHRFPVFLQMRLWGEVRLEDRWDTCGTDHDSIHAMVSHLIDGWVKPTLSPGRLVMDEVDRVVAWYRAEQAKIPTYGSGAFGTGPYGGPRRDPNAQWDGIE